MNFSSNLTLDNSSIEQYLNNFTDTGRTFRISPCWSLEYAILIVMVTGLALIGIVGNISVLIVYFRRRDNLVSNTFIKVLAFIDLVVCVFGVSYSIVYELHLVTSDIVCRFCEFVIHFCIFASNITLVAIATERYIAVCQIHTKLNVSNINVGIWVIFILSAILGAPAVGTFAVVQEAERDVKCRFSHEYSSGTFCQFTYSVMGRTLVTAYQIVSLAMFLISALVIAVLYCIIYYALWKKSSLRRGLNRAIADKLESISEEAFVEQCRPFKCLGSQSQRQRGESRANGEVSSDIVTDNLIERRESCSVESRNGQENTNGSHSDSSGTKDRKVRRKIKFSVSAQSGRSEKRKRKKYYHKRTAKMLFFCTVIYIVSWLPFFIDVFGITDCLILRYLFFFGNATNPIVYGIVNEQVRRAFKKLFLGCISGWCRIGGSLHRENIFVLTSSTFQCTSTK